MWKTTKVVVVGGGAIGLTTALALLEAGFEHVQVMADHFSPNTTSDGAGAIWRPFELSPLTDQGLITRWCRVTKKWLCELQDQYGSESGVNWAFGKEFMMTSLKSHPYWAHLMKDFRFLSESELRAEGHGFRFGYCYGTLMIHPVVNLKLIRRLIQERGGELLQRQVHSLDEIKADMIVNCTGLDGGRLAMDDSTCFPIRGQTVKVHHPNIKEFCIVHEGPLSLSYILPRMNGEVVLGGTVDPNNANSKNCVSDISGIIDRCFELKPELRDATRLGEWAGLRPQRQAGPRIELGSKKTKSGAIVLHNYGHGGSGHTLHWGCAQDVAALAFSAAVTSRL